MPIMNGFSCSAAVREWERSTERSRRQPICAISVHNGAREIELCAEVGVDYFEAKPARVPGLLEIVSRCMRPRR